jgi:hypothetical protein
VRHHGTAIHNGRYSGFFSGGVMASDQYRRWGFEAQGRAAAADDTDLKEGFRLLAQGWLALADQLDWVERRFTSLVGRSKTR